MASPCSQVDYDDPSFNYRQYWQERQYEDRADKLALQKLLDFVPQGQTIADVGGGFGRLTPVYAQKFKQCFLLDPSKKLLGEAKKLTRKYPNLVIKKGQAEKLPFTPESLEVIICIRTLHHLAEPQVAIKEFYRVLKPNGFLILEFANKAHLKSILKGIIRQNYNYLLSHRPENISTVKKMPFFNYHPSHIKTLLLANRFSLKKILSVSNFRSPIIKKLLPLKVLLSWESKFSLLASRFSLLAHFGPSIFILAQKSSLP